MLQCVERVLQMCCSALQLVVVCCSALNWYHESVAVCCKYVARVCCKCVAVCQLCTCERERKVLQYVASVLHVAV